MSKCTTLLWLLCVSILLNAQDIHFSQFYHTPFVINPALTGIFESRGYRLSAHYRNQWSSIPATYRTMAFSLDGKFLENNLVRNGFAGGGLSIVSDQGGNGNLRAFYALFSAAYHKIWGKAGHHSVSLGYQLGLVQKRLEIDELKFPNQFLADVGYDAGTASGEYFPDFKIFYADMQAGLLWKYRPQGRYEVYSGLSWAHFNQASESFLKQQQLLASRFVLHGGAKIKTGTKTRLLPHFLYMTQAKAMQVNTGTGFEYFLNTPKLPSEIILGIGMFSRWNTNPDNKIQADALVPVIYTTYRDWQVSMSYDINISGLQAATHHRGGMEVAVIRVLPVIRKQLKGPGVIVPCEVF